MIRLPPGEYTGEYDEFLFNTCVNCGKEKHFYWNVIKKVGYCHVCHVSIVGQQALESWVQCSEFDEPISFYKPIESLLEIPAWFDDNAKYYLMGRGISQEQSFRAHITLIPEKSMLRIPVTPLSPELPIQHLNRYYKFADSKWRLEGKSWSATHYIGDCREKKEGNLLLCEGWMDLFSSGTDTMGVALLGTHLTSIHYGVFQGITQRGGRIFSWLDPDSAGLDCAEALKRASKVWGFTHYDLTSILQVEPKKASQAVIAKVKKIVGGR